MLLTKVKKTVRHHSLLVPGDRVVVAVSGGPDSVCLLFALHALSGELGILLHVAHLDHMFRGKESAEEALFVGQLASRLAVPVTIERFDVPAFCRERGLSPQEGARIVRYAFLQRAARDAGASRIATGHTADDQAETFLMRLIRGAGTSGLSGIPPVRDNIIRPLIDATREEVAAYLHANALVFVTDSSNAKRAYTRNRVRLDVLPVLKKFNPRIVETLAREAAIFREESEAVEAYLGTLAESSCQQKDGTLSMKRDAFTTLPPAFRRRLLRRLVDLAGLDASALPLAQINDALSFMDAAQTGRTMNLPHGLSITREYNRFVFTTREVTRGFSHALSVPGTTAIPELGMTAETALSEGRGEEDEDGDANYLWQALFDYDKIGPLVTIRNRCPGDRFFPAGMGGRSKKIQDYLVDEKVPRRKRDDIPLLCSGEDILWVIGHRMDERFLPHADAKKVLIVRVKSSAGGS